jgi:hypothetical protein
MSDAFFNLLSIENQYRCRKVDQLLLFTEDDSMYDIQDVRDRIESGDKMNMVSKCNYFIFSRFVRYFVHISIDFQSQYTYDMGM